MASSRIFRLVESSLVALFFLQGARTVFADLLHLLDSALATRQVGLQAVNSYLLLLVALAPPWFVPRSRRRLPLLLMVTAMGSGAARLGLAVALPDVRFYAGLAILALSGAYFVSLIRASHRTWIAAIIVGLTFEQLLRARDTLDLSLRPVTDLPVGDLRLRMPMVVLQAVVFVALLGVSVMARRSARRESFEPANVTVLGGLAVGGWIALHLVVLGLPNVMARWTGVPYAALVPWVILALVLPLVPGVRNFVGEALSIFDERLRGWVWLFLFLLMLVVGNRLRGFGAAGALVMAQFLGTMLLWWITTPLDAEEIEQVGPSLSLGLTCGAALMVAYALTFAAGGPFGFLSGQSLTVTLVAGALLGLPRLRWRDDDPWLVPSQLPDGLMIAFAAPAVVFGLVLSGSLAEPLPPSIPQEVRVATYNVNGGYDGHGVFQIEQIARTIEVSLADVVVLQEVDTGTPLGHGIDGVEYLARRLRMYHAYQATREGLRGIAVLSRWPFAAQDGTLLPSAQEQMGAVRVLIADPGSGRVLSVIGAQFEAADEQMRLQQLAVIFSIVDPQASTVLAIDLRAGPDDPLYAQLTGGSFIDPDQVLGIERGYTTPADSPVARHDFVLLRGLIPSESQQVANEAGEPSDHRLVVVRLSWP